MITLMCVMIFKCVFKLLLLFLSSSHSVVPSLPFSTPLYPSFLYTTRLTSYRNDVENLIFAFNSPEYFSVKLVFLFHNFVTYFYFIFLQCFNINIHGSRFF